MPTLGKLRNKTSSPKVSVIIPAHNASKFIRDAIKSVLNQTYKDYEIIVIDGRNGSTDNTREIVAEYEDKVRYLHQENTGLSDARNKGILSAKGEYIAFLDSDDLWFEKKLALQIEFLENHRDIGLVFSDAWIKAYGAVDAEDRDFIGKRFFQINKPYRKQVLGQLFVSNFIPILTVVVRKECILKVGLFKEDLDSAEDYDLWLRMSRMFKIDYIDAPLAIYRFREDSLYHKRESLFSNLMLIKKNILESEPQLLKQLSREKMDKALYRLHFNLGNHYLLNDKHKKARDAYRKYLSLNPRDPRVFILLLMTFLQIQYKSLYLAVKSFKTRAFEHRIANFL